MLISRCLVSEGQLRRLYLEHETTAMNAENIIEAIADLKTSVRSYVFIVQEELEPSTRF